MYKICVWDLFSTLLTAMNWALTDDRQFLPMTAKSGIIPVTHGGLPGQRHWENCMAVGTTSLSVCGAYRLSPDCVHMQSGNLFSLFLALYAFLRQYKFCLTRPIVRYCNFLHTKLCILEKNSGLYLEPSSCLTLSSQTIWSHHYWKLWDFNN